MNRDLTISFRLPKQMLMEVRNFIKDRGYTIVGFIVAAVREKIKRESGEQQ